VTLHPCGPSSTLRRRGRPAPFADGVQVIETYPVLVLIALKWLRGGRGTSGILPKYNPQRTATFSSGDSKFVCECTAEFFVRHSALRLAAWLADAAQWTNPNKRARIVLTHTSASWWPCGCRRGASA
jgi:hypothetical protein